MGLYSKMSPVQGIQVVVWNLSESVEELLRMTPLCASETEACLAIPVPAKQKEFLAGKYVIEKACTLLNIPYHGLAKDEHGKPYLLDSELDISLTHTEEYVAVAFSEIGAVGLDLEQPRDQILRIFPRLFSVKEVEDVQGDLDEATVYWSAKEAMYKLYGKRAVDFRKHLLLWRTGELLEGEIRMDDFQHNCRFFITKLAPYYLVLVY
jgi:4'-phosphopantetheinyl transferase